MYPVDDLFAAYARSFEAHREAEMTLPEYLNACRHDPLMYATTTERLLAAIDDPAFSEFRAVEETVERIVGHLRHQTLTAREELLSCLRLLEGLERRLASRLRAALSRQPYYVVSAGD